MPNLSKAKKTGHAVAHKRLKLKLKQDAEEARWDELERLKKNEKNDKKQGKTKEALKEEPTGDSASDKQEKDEHVSTSAASPAQPPPSASLSSDTSVTVQKKRSMNPNLLTRIDQSKKQKAIKVSHVSSVPVNDNLKTTFNAFDVLGNDSQKKKKKK